MTQFKKWLNLNKYLVFLLIMVNILVFIGIFAPIIAPHDPLYGDLKQGFIPPNSEYWFGTDKLGRDIFSRVLYGIRISLGISASLIMIILFFGGILGILSGYLGGVVDKIIMAISDVLISCPSMVLAIALTGLMNASVQNAMLAIFIVTISKYVRLTRSLVLQIVNTEYIKSAKMCGTSHVNILIKHIIPNISQTLLVTASTDLGSIILELSALSFLGFGIPAPLPELGFMINDGRAFMLNAPWIVAFPGLAILIIVSVLNLTSDKLRDLL